MMDVKPTLPLMIRLLGWATVAAMLPLVALGGQTTTRMAGMADPVWPTEPWYLVVNNHVFFEEPQPGFLLEHTHRLAGWIAGAMASLFALSIWGFTQNRGRVIGLIVTFALLMAYGAFHGAMMKIKTDPQAFGPAQSTPGIIAVIFAVGLIGLAIWSKSGVRILASLGLVGVMIQGLLGGFRVLLNAWFGPDLAIVHGCFAHVVFCTFIAALTLAASPRVILETVDKQAIGKWLLLAVGLVSLQLVWGALTRHTGTAFAQRLHMLTAFLATAAVLMTVFTISNRPAIPFKMMARGLVILVFLQVAFGVEAYLGKFASLGSYAHLPPSQRPISNGAAFTRTSHVVIGLFLLADLVALSVHVFRTKPLSVKSNDGSLDGSLDQSTNLEPVAV